MSARPGRGNDDSGAKPDPWTLSTGPMRIVRWGALDPASRARLSRRGVDWRDPELGERVRALVDDVRSNGDDALIRALREFDGCAIESGGLRVGADELERARADVPASLVDAIRHSIARVRRFNELAIGEREWMAELEPGLEVGQKRTPIPSAGLFVPSGKGSYPSSLVQIATPAIVAGVPEIAIAVPPIPGEDGRVDSAVLVVAAELGIDQVFRANGPAGIAALAFGTESIPPTVKVLGPGSPAVQIAQMEIQRHGTATVMILGPTECMVIADATADPRLLAADLLSEAEHGTDSAAVLVTADEALLEAVNGHLSEQVTELPEMRSRYARAALGQVGGAVLVEDLGEAADLANEYAPEHLQIATADPPALLAAIDYAAEVLLGQSTPFAVANYTIGVPAALPTSRFARVSSGVTAASFTRETSIARLDRRAMQRLSPATLALAEWEGFPAHAAAVDQRPLAKANPNQEVT